MPEAFRLYLDQMMQKYVAEVLSRDGYNVVRASEMGQARADDLAILQKAVSERKALVSLMIISGIGLFYLWTDMLE